MAGAAMGPRSRSVERAAALLRALAADPGRSASALAREIEVPRPTVARLLAALEREGLVERAPRPAASWELGRELHRLGLAAEPMRDLARRARPVLRRLAAGSRESAMLGVASATRVEVIAQADADSFVGATNWLGRSLTGLHASSGGKLYLAALEPEELERWLETARLERFTERTIVEREALLRELGRVRGAGVAETVDELEDGVVSLSAPVGPLRGDSVFALGISGPSFRLTRARRQALAVPLRLAAAELAQLLT